ncbi:MAG TPA: Zn-ribbon domain-containing OB-fold protein [Longimicrobiales bacterium]
MPSPRYWREIPARYRLEGGRCTACGKALYPARKVCPACRGTDMEPINLSRRGTVVTSTVIRVPPDDFVSEAPYAVAIVETPEGARLMAQVADCAPEDVHIGMDVTLEFRKIRREGVSGILCYGYKAVPVEAAVPR